MIHTSTSKREPSFHMLLGLTIALAVSLCALEYGKPRNGKADYIGQITDDPWNIEDELPPITVPKKLPEPPPQTPPSKPQVVTASVFPTELIITSEPILEEGPELDIASMDALFTEEKAVLPDIPFDFVEVFPEFIGSESALQRFLGKETDYPDIARDLGIEGIVWVKFTIDKKGHVDRESVEILRSPHPSLSKEAIRVVKKMPDWIPGRQGVHDVAVNMRLPIKFTLIR